MADRQIIFDLLARDRASQTISKVGSTAQTTSRQLESLGGGGSRMGSMLAAGAAAGVAAFGALAVAGAAVGVKTAASMEQAQIAFGQLLGSGEKAKTFLADLSQFAATTPFEFQGLVDSSRLLIGVGATTEQTKAILQDFGDTAGALGVQGDAFNRVILATSQAMSAGKFQAGDLNQIMTNGIPIWSILSKATGKSVAELRAMSEKGKLLASDVMPALLTQMQKDYGGSMAKQSQTLNGLWSTLKDTLSLGMGKALTPLIPLIKDGLTGAINLLTPAMEWLSGAISKVIGWFKSAGSEGGVVSGVMKSLHGDVKSLQKAWNDHQQAVGIVVAAFKIFGSYLKNLLGPYLGEIIKLVGFTLTPAFRLLATAIELVFPVVRGFAQLTLTVFGAIVHGAASAFSWVPGIGPKLQAAAQKFDAFRDSVNASLDGIRSRTVTVAFGAVFTPGSGDIFRKYGGIGTGVGVLKTGSASVTLSPSKVTTKVPSFGGGGGGFGGGGGGGGSSKKTGPTAAGKEFWNGILTSFKEAEPKIAAVLDRFADKVAKVKITEKTRTRLTGIVQTIATALERDTARLKDVKDRISEQKRALDDLIKARTDYSKQLSSGLRGDFTTLLNLSQDSEGNVFDPDKQKKLEKAQDSQQKASDQLAAATKRLNNLRAEAAARTKQTVSQENALRDAQEAVTAAMKRFQDAQSNLTSAQSDVAGADPVTDLQNKMANRLAAINAFQANLQKLQADGLSKDMIQQMAAAGLESGGAMAAALVKASPEAIANLNKLNSQITQASDAFGEQWSSAMYDAGIQAAQGLLKGLDSQQTVIEAHIDQLGRLLIQRMAGVLGVKAPSIPAAVTPISAAKSPATVVNHITVQASPISTPADVARTLERTLFQAKGQGVTVNLNTKTA